MTATRIPESPMADMSATERARDAIGWFVKTRPDSEEQQLLDDIATAITEAVEAERAACHTKLIEGLVAVYGNGSVLVARLCDEYLDRSGTLLGEVRDAAIEARAEKPVAADVEGE